MAFQENYYSSNGIQLHTLEAGDPEARTILFLHGFPEFWYAWEKQLPFFAERGWHAVAPDQRGYNLSSKPEGEAAYAMAQLTKDIAELIPQISKGKVVLVGHDWGGGVAWNLASQYPHLLEKLVILNMPHPKVLNQHLSSNIRQMRRSWYTAFFQLPWLPEFFSGAFHFKLLEKSLAGSAVPGTFTAQQMTHYKKAWSQPKALESMINWYRAYRYSPPKEILKIEVPTLLVWGRKDPFLGEEMAQPSIDTCRKGQLIFLEEATHWLHHEQPTQVNEAIQTFLEER
jgi:epoxide hydrolase 4